LGVPGGIYALLLKISALVLSILGIVFVLQNRAVVARWIEGSDPATAAGLSRLRYRLGETWHVLAIAYIGAIYLAYALRVESGSGFILRATLVSLVVIVGARLLARFIEELSARGFAIAPKLQARFPELEKRANRYTPMLTGFAGVAIYGLAFLLVLQAWDIRSFAWFETGLGRQTSGALLSIGLVLAIALAVWELFSAAIEPQLAGLDAHGPPSRARRRPLLLRQVCDDLNADEELGPWILDPFDYQGIDSLDELSVALVLRVRTVAGKQFIVGRALNRLIKIAFEAHGIAMRDPAPMLLAGPTT